MIGLAANVCCQTQSFQHSRLFNAGCVIFGGSIGEI